MAPPLRILLRGSELLLLALWLACGISVFVAATAAFPSLSSRGAVLPGFEALAAADPAASGRLVAGVVMDRVFAATDAAQWWIGAASLLVAAALAVSAPRRRRRAPLLLLALVVLAFALVAVHNLSIAPAMEQSLATYRQLAADAASLDAAAAQRESFDRDHRLAERLYSLRMLAVAASLLLLAFSPAPRRSVR